MTYLSDLNFIRTAANIATVLFAIFIGMQLLLAAGVLPVTIAWGGRQTELTPALRAASVAAAVILVVFIYIIRSRAGLMGQMPAPSWIYIAAWVVTGFMALNTLGNFASVNNVERFVSGPLTVAITLACLVVAASQME